MLVVLWLGELVLRSQALATELGSNADVHKLDLERSQALAKRLGLSASMLLDISQATTTAPAKGRSNMADEPGAKDGRAQRPVRLDGQSSGKALLGTSTAQADALSKARARIVEIDALLKTLGALKEPMVVALVADLKKERARLRTTVNYKDLVRIAEIDATLKTIDTIKEPKVEALALDLKRERDGLRTKASVEDDSADVTGATVDAKADGAQMDTGKVPDSGEDP